MRSTAFSAPFFLFAYGVLRWIDGLDGKRHDGLAWTVGHVSFAVSMVLFAVLAFEIRRMVRWRAAATAPAVLTCAGVLATLWVIAYDLGAGLAVPGWLVTGGPMVFALGVLALQGLAVGAGRLPWWSPLLFVLGYAAIGVNLDLLPVGALLVLGAFLPLAKGATGGTPGGTQDAGRVTAPSGARDGRLMGRVGALTPAGRFTVD